MTIVRTRFAPSPTGYLHVGSARTALYAYLYARHCNGQFVLRIEDTDQERSTQASVQAIIEGMTWLGLDYDEGPFYQTQRLKRYLAVADQLVAQQKAYRCYCSKQRLETLRQTQIAHKQKPKYDQFCLHHANSNTEQKQLPYVIRFVNPIDGQVVFDDAVHGETVFHNTELDDLILVRSDGVPTYNFCVVVDDWDMQITHVIRGDDHLNNTPRQINILKALGAKLPVYAHIPMILGSDGKRLSKRHGAVDIMQFKQEGFLPEALLNYLVRLGWSAGDQEIFSMSELIRLFDLRQVNKSAASMNLSKLIWLNQHYVKTAQLSLIKSAFEAQLARENIDINIKNPPDVLKIISIQRERCKTLKEMAEKSRFFYEYSLPSPELQQKWLTSELKSAVNDFADFLRTESSFSWTEDHIQTVIQTIIEQTGIKLGDFAQAMRVILTGSTISPPLYSTIYVLGKATVLTRIQYLLSSG